MTENKIFKQITNDDVYKKLCEIDAKVSHINGTIRFHSWAIGAIILIICGLIAAVV